MTWGYLRQPYTPTAAVKQERYVREPRLRARKKTKRAAPAASKTPKAEADYTGRAVVFAECSERLRELPHGDIAAVLQALCLCFNAK